MFDKVINATLESQEGMYGNGAHPDWPSTVFVRVQYDTDTKSVFIIGATRNGERALNPESLSGFNVAASYQVSDGSNAFDPCNEYHNDIQAAAVIAYP